MVLWTGKRNFHKTAEIFSLETLKVSAQSDKKGEKIRFFMQNTLAKTAHWT